MAYAGALEPLDKNDCGPHGFFAGEYQDGRVRITFVPWAARDYRWLEIRTDENSTDFSVQRQIAEYVQENGTKHIYRVRLEVLPAHTLPGSSGTPITLWTWTSWRM